MTKALHADGVSKQYHRLRFRGARPWREVRSALDGVSIDVEPGEAVGLLGPNGSGKTTFLKASIGLVALDAGRMVVWGNRVRGGLGPVADQVGAVIDPVRFMPALSARTTIGLLASAASLPQGHVDDVLDRVGLGPVADRPVRTLSLGMRQRLALAVAMLRTPCLLLLDEPANGLDPAGAHQLRQFLREFVAGGGAVLVSSHALSDLQSLVTRVVVLNRGRVVYDGALDELCSSPGRWYVAIEESIDRLVSVLAGYELRREGAGVVVQGARSPGELSRLLVANGCTLTELRPIGVGLEQRYLELIGDDLDSAWGT
ncbi:MAG: ABC transporter ATP-binding protein [Acidimicrobiales bacterium]|nr:ABC transporter ATP-binding protein [Acidimicrobiales bacterium]